MPLHRQSIFRLAIGVIYAIAVLWLVFAMFWLFRDSAYRYFYAVSAIGNGLVLAVLAYLIYKRRMWAWWTAIIIMCVNIILTITDQVGVFDFVYLVPASSLFVLLLSIRSSVNQPLTKNTHG